MTVLDLAHGVKMLQALPVINMALYEKVKKASSELAQTEGFPFFKPTNGYIITRMQKLKDWSMLFCFNNSNFFFNGCLMHNWNKCKLKDSILGVERTFDKWYAVDIYVFEGTTLFHLTFLERRALLFQLSEQFEFMTELQMPDAMGSRLWSN